MTPSHLRPGLALRLLPDPEAKMGGARSGCSGTPESPARQSSRCMRRAGGLDTGGGLNPVSTRLRVSGRGVGDPLGLPRPPLWEPQGRGGVLLPPGWTDSLLRGETMRPHVQGPGTSSAHRGDLGVLSQGCWFICFRPVSAYQAAGPGAWWPLGPALAKQGAGTRSSGGQPLRRNAGALRAPVPRF